MRFHTRDLVFVLVIFSLLIALAINVYRVHVITYLRIGHGVSITGELGVPVGESVEISGTKTYLHKFGNFTVEKINGTPVDPITILVRRIESWPSGTAATFQGYEVGELRYLHIEATSYGRNDERWDGPYQHIFLSFEPRSVESELQLDPD